MFCDIEWIMLDVVSSTNNFLRRLNTSNDRRMTLVTAEYQTGGRGAGTNSWESAKGMNLLMSLRMKPRDVSVSRMFALSEAVALAVRDAIIYQCVKTNFVTHHFNLNLSKFTLKWPNDIYYGESKVAGILIENDLFGDMVRSSVIGIGINVNQQKFESDAPNPRSLADIVGHDVDRLALLEKLIEKLTEYVHMVEGVNEDALDALHENYKKHLYGFDKIHEFSDEKGDFNALISDVEPSGHLILRDEYGVRRRYAFKEVRYRPPNPL